MKKMIIGFVGLFILLGGLYLFDYIRVTNYDKVPFIAVKKVDKENQLTLYKAIFYQVWVCDNKDEKGKVVKVIGDYKDDMPECSKSLDFSKGDYTNPYGVKISLKNYQIIGPIYSVETINSWQKSTDLDNALYVVNELERNFFIIKDNSTFNYLNEIVNIAIFYDLVTNDDIYTWEAMVNDNNYYYCVKQDNNKKYLFSKYTNGTCDGMWNYKTFTDKWCSLTLKEKDGSTVRQYADANCN